MNILDANWQPNGADPVTWFAMDASGMLAVMSSNGFGNLPPSLLAVDRLRDRLKDFSEFLFEESEIYPSSLNKRGAFVVNFYSSWFYRNQKDKGGVELEIARDLNDRGPLSEANLCSSKGFFMFEALDHGNVPGEYPVGYPGNSGNGDYYKYLSPTVPVVVEDIPLELRKVIARSTVVRFTELALLENCKVSSLFDFVDA